MELPAHVGRYEVRGEIAKGGFAVVVQAWDEDLQSLVAIKILHPEWADNREVVERFLQEARLLRRIRCLSVVTVHDVGRLGDGRPYFIMDFADQGTLAERLKRCAQPVSSDPGSVQTFIEALADGVGALHDAGVIHRDLKPANILFQLARRRQHDDDATAIATPDCALLGIDERILVGDLGIAKDLVERGSQATMLGGSPLYQAPEQNDASALITPAADVYAASALLWHVLSGTPPPEPGELGTRLSILPTQWHDVLEQGMASDPADRFVTMETWRSAALDALDNDDRGQQPVAPTTISHQAPCPYKGLASYQPEDARYFYGRETLIDELVRRIQLHRVLVVGGPSGSGKSSLVRAGLIPAIRAGALPGSENWQVALFTPGRDPMAEFHYQLTRNAREGTTVSIDDLLERPTLARRLGPGQHDGQSLLLCIDQFEELFTLAPSAQRQAFAEALSAMTDPADSQVRVVITVRADFYGACALLPWLAERITENQVLVGPMSGPELRRAIAEPARHAGLHLERGLVDAILDEAGNEAGALPLVAHALVETWARRRGNTLTVAGFEAAGGVAGAISQTADAKFNDHFNEAEREATRRLFLRLVTPGEGTADTRRVFDYAEIDHDSDPDTMRKVVASLTDARLLTVDDTTVQIAHEALIRTWPRLRGWINECRDDLRARERISHAAAEWNQQEQHPDLLYHGTPLLSALEWSAERRDQLDTLELAFLNASREAMEAAKQAAAEQETRARRRRHAAMAVLVLLAGGATAASVVAFKASQRSQINEERAELATAEAVRQFAGALGTAANGLVDSEPLLALVLAAESTARAAPAAAGFDARTAMLRSRQVLAGDGPFLLGAPIAAGDALDLAVSADGNMLATGQRDGRIELIDSVSRQRIGEPLQGHSGGVEEIAFAPDGRSLASVSDDGTLRLWATGEGSIKQAASLAFSDDIVWGVAFSHDGSMLATAGEDGTVRLWDVARRAQLGEPLIERMGDFLSVAFSPDDQSLVAGNGDGEIYGWDLQSRQYRFAPLVSAHQSDVWKLAFSPDGDSFATASSDGSTVVVEFPEGKVSATAFSGSGSSQGVAYTPSGERLVGGTPDGSVRVWDTRLGDIISTTPSGHDQPIIDLHLSGDGTLLATLAEDQLIRLWRFGPEAPLSQDYRVAGGAARAVAFGDQGRLLAAGDRSGSVSIWDLNHDQPPRVYSEHREGVWALAFSPDSRLLASGDRAGRLQIRDLASGTLVADGEHDDGAIWWCAFSPDGQQIISAADRGIRIQDVASGADIARIDAGDAAITRAALSPDGALLAVADNSGRIGIYKLPDGSLLKEFGAADDVVWSVAFSPDGQRLITASSDEVVSLWDLAGGQQLMSLTGHTDGATDTVLLADGVTLAVVDRAGELRLWDTVTGRRLGVPIAAHTGNSWRLAMHPDGVRFATSGDDGVVRVWDLLSIRTACEIGADGFDPLQRRRYLGGSERSYACDPAS